MAQLDQQDLEAIKGLVEITLDEKLDQKLDEKLDSKLSNLKSEIFEKIDSFAKESDASHQERTLLSEHSSRNTKRIEKLETKVFGQITE